MTTNRPLKNCRSWDDVQDELFGPKGTPQRDQLEKESEMFRISKRLKLARKDSDFPDADRLTEEISLK